ncbi:MAG: GNAT family N-acetyltransferase [Proteobacteria bacterium]|nr:GNAT family N-acetyltransferase [Pseudomonadota bacterium]MBU1738775.1 GNAT family N-acetyltransferase [Pseudomonadota bacterium]
MTNNEFLHISGSGMQLVSLTTRHVSKSYVSWLNDQDVNKFLETRHSVQNYETICKYIMRMASMPDVYFFAIFLNGNQFHIGNIKLEVNPIHKRGEISLVIGEKSCWGKGFGTEAITLIRNFGLHDLQLNKLTAGCYSNNLGSAKAFEKAGFKREAVLSDHYWTGDQWVDRWCYAFWANNSLAENI